MENDNININRKYQELKPYQQKIVERFLDNFGIINTVDVSSISSEGMVCRKCGTTHFVKNGTVKTVQRYKCRTCRSTQFHDANTPLYNLKLKGKWADFVFIMLDKDRSKTCKSISNELDVNIKTAHSWRHKFLSSLNAVNDLELVEESELDEVYFPFTVKGVIGKEKYEVYVAPDHVDNIESKLRIEEKEMEEQKYQSIFMCIHNRNSDFDFVPIKNLKKGIVSEVDLTRVMSDFNLSGKTVITDSEPSMKLFLSKIDDVNHLTFKSSDIKKGISVERNIHNNNINNTIMLLREWIKKFHGVSTKFLWNYLKWFRFIRLFEFFKIKEMVGFSLSDKKSYPRYKNIFTDYVAFVNA